MAKSPKKGKGYGRNAFDTFEEWRAYRDRKNAENRRSRARKKELAEATKIQNTLNTTRMSKQARNKLVKDMNMHISNAEAMVVKNDKGQIIRSAQEAERNRQNIMQTKYSNQIQYNTVTKEQYEQNKKTILSDFRNLQQTRRSDVDIFKAVTKDLWVGSGSTAEMLDKIVEYYQEYDFGELFEEIVKQAKEKANVNSFSFKVNKNEFTEEQREIYDLVFKNDVSDAEQEYKEVVAAKITYEDIVIEHEES